MCSPTDSSYYNSLKSCGGNIPLTYSSPNATYASPYYYQNSSHRVDIDCCWYISSPTGEEVHLALIDMELSNGYFYVYDHMYSTSSSYRLSYMKGSLNAVTNVLSSRGGLTVVLYDAFSYDQPHIGHGVLFEASIMSTNDSLEFLCSEVVLTT